METKRNCLRKIVAIIIIIIIVILLLLLGKQCLVPSTSSISPMAHLNVPAAVRKQTKILWKKHTHIHTKYTRLKRERKKGARVAKKNGRTATTTMLTQHLCSPCKSKQFENIVLVVNHWLTNRTPTLIKKTTIYMNTHAHKRPFPQLRVRMRVPLLLLLLLLLLQAHLFGDLINICKLHTHIQWNVFCVKQKRKMDREAYRIQCALSLRSRSPYRII